MEQRVKELEAKVERARGAAEVKELLEGKLERERMRNNAVLALRDLRLAQREIRQELHREAGERRALEEKLARLERKVEKGAMIQRMRELQKVEQIRLETRIKEMLKTTAEQLAEKIACQEEARARQDDLRDVKATLASITMQQHHSLLTQQQTLAQPLLPYQLRTGMAPLELGPDNRADDLTKEGMLKGIQDSAAFILFLRLHALPGKEADAIKELLYMFAVTLEDFVHSMQWVQTLLDHSLVFGCTTEGIYVHDIVLKFARKRLEPSEMRGLHKNAVAGMVLTSKERVQTVGGSGLQQTGNTHRAFDGEEIDWYVCNVGHYHMASSIDQAVPIAENEHATHLLKLGDPVLLQQAAMAVGDAALQTLLAHYKENEEPLAAAQVIWATCVGFPGHAKHDQLKESLVLLKQLQVKPSSTYAALVAPRGWTTRGMYPSKWPGGVLTREAMDKGSMLQWEQAKLMLGKAAAQAFGARKEMYLMLRLVFCVAQTLPCLGPHPSEASTAFGAQVVDSEVCGGRGCANVLKLLEKFSCRRHLEIARSAEFASDMYTFCSLPNAVGELSGDLGKFIIASDHQHRYMLDFKLELSPVPGIEMYTRGDRIADELAGIAPQFQGDVYSFYEAVGLTKTEDVEQWWHSSPDNAPFAAYQKKSPTGSACGQFHRFHLHSIIPYMSSPADDPTVHDMFYSATSTTGTRTLIAEAFEKEGRLDEAVTWARAELVFESNHNCTSKARAGRVLGRCHAALEESTLSEAAFESALALAKSRRLLLTEALTVRAWAQAAAAAGCDSAKRQQRLGDMLQRLSGDEALREALLAGGQQSTAGSSP
eukprot:g286.t1